MDSVAIGFEKSHLTNMLFLWLKFCIYTTLDLIKATLMLIDKVKFTVDRYLTKRICTSLCLPAQSVSCIIEKKKKTKVLDKLTA